MCTRDEHLLSSTTSPWLWLLCLAWLAACGCHSGPEGGVPGAPKQAPHEMSLEKVLGNLHKPMLEMAQQEALRPSVEASVEGLGEQLHYPALLRQVYSAQAPEAWLERGSLTPQGEALLRVLQGSRGEALDPVEMHAPELEKRLLRLKEQASGLQQQASGLPSLSSSEQAALREMLQASPQASEQALARAVLEAPGQPQEGDARSWHAQYKASLESWAQGQREVELLLADGVLRYANRMKFSNPHIYPEEKQIAPGIEEMARRSMAEFLGQVVQARSPQELEALLQRLAPVSPQYAGLVKALARYEELAARGGWSTELPSLPKPRRGKVVRYSRGNRGLPKGMIKAVRARLAAEGYLAPGASLESDAWDDAFEEGLLAYRETHQQYTRKLFIDYEMLESMRIPVEYRVAQIKTALHRLRQSRASQSMDYYILINIPDFHAEVWDKGELLKRFKVIVGSTQGYIDKETGLWQYPNATPQFSDVMETIVFNPFWNVPPRIRRELQRKAEDDPDYYARHNYEVLQTSAGHEILRQKPGAGNALGQVKFLFPNEHDIYMHDTPRKDLFNNPVRAYSHGCMRVHEPLELAAFLLQREDDTWTPGRARAIARSGKQFRYSLERGPAVHIEYRTVRVDEQGRPHFLADIYEQDARYIAERYKLTFTKRD